MTRMCDMCESIKVEMYFQIRELIVSDVMYTLLSINEKKKKINKMKNALIPLHTKNKNK